ncbi:MAG: orotate phosphoribosyltransferase [Saprospiraceae bacterium]
MGLSAQVAQQLLMIKAVKLSPNQPFTWASGILSPIYCDNRIVLSHPEARKIVKKGFVKMASQFGDFDVVAGVATAGIPHGALLADALNLPFIYVRDKPKSHGRQNQIEGELQEGQRVLVIEDLISTGGSSLKAIEAIVEAGGKIAGILAIFTYGFQEATELFQSRDIPMMTLSDYNQLIDEALKLNYISSGDLESLKIWRKDPKNWRNP